MPTKILVADDSATMRRVLEMTFAGEDANVVSVDSGDAALAKIGDFAPDIVFADATLAGVDGYELARRIKGHPAHARVAVIVMASQHTPYDDAKGRAAGVDDNISKPFDTQSVIDRVAQVLARARNLPAGAEAPQSVAPAAPAPAPVAPAPVARPAVPTPAAAPAVPVQPPPRMGSTQGTRIGLGAPTGPVPLAPAAAARPAVPVARPNATMPMAPVPPSAPKVVPAPAAAAPAVAVTRPAAAVSVGSVSADMSSKLEQLGLTREQIEGVLALSREVITQVVWEVVPDLAEQLIKEEIKRLTAE